MKVLLIGYGRMGREVQIVLAERGHTVVKIIDENNYDEVRPDLLAAAGADVAIEFTVPQTAFHNIAACLRAGLPVVSGTTGWTDRMAEAEELCRELSGTFFYASNYSVGVNMMFRINRVLASMMDRFPQYDVTVEETHHVHKKDAPSGTAITLAEDITGRLRRKKEWVSGHTTDPSGLGVSSVRRSVVPGTHAVTYESTADMLRIEHQAHGRRGFAEGAVLAAEFTAGRTGIFSMEDLLGFDNI